MDLNNRPLLIIIYLCILFSNSSYSSDERLFSVSFGPVQVGESRLPVNLKNFKITSTISNDFAKAQFLKNTVQWIRTNNNLLTPRARLGIKIKDTSANIHIVYLNNPILPETRNNFLYCELYIPLFNPGTIYISKNGKIIGSFNIKAMAPKDKETHLIDYSCAPYNLEITGLENEYLSVGCNLRRIGNWGKETNRLEVSWISTNFRLLDGASPPYVSTLTGNNPVRTMIIDQDKNKKTLSIKGRLSKRAHRLKTAFGIGPYFFSTKQFHMSRDSKVAPSVMLYANFYLSPSTSLRAFDALVWQDSKFNNFGLYFAYELADAMDKRISLVPLLGIQGLTFQYNNNTKYYHKIIYPQGFEFLYKHAFGKKNYHLFFGMFFDAASEYDYINSWARWGKRIFWEINYIRWADEDKEASMWGLSAGIPFMSFF